VNDITLNPREKLLVRALCYNDLLISGASKSLGYHRNTVTYQCKNIEKRTGLDPTNFFDAMRLYELCCKERND